MIFATVRTKQSVISIQIVWVEIFCPGQKEKCRRQISMHFPMFFSRLNEICGSCEKVLAVSGSFWSNLKFFKMMLLTVYLCG